MTKMEMIIMTGVVARVGAAYVHIWQEVSGIESSRGCSRASRLLG
jgi:hypothetical protein